MTVDTLRQYSLQIFAIAAITQVEQIRNMYQRFRMYYIK